MSGKTRIRCWIAVVLLVGLACALLWLLARDARSSPVQAALAFAPLPVFPESAAREAACGVDRVADFEPYGMRTTSRGAVVVYRARCPAPDAPRRRREVHGYVVTWRRGVRWEATYGGVQLPLRDGGAL